MTERDELWDEAQKLSTLFKMFGVEARAYSHPLRIMWKTRNEDHGGGIRSAVMVHSDEFATADEWRAAAHARIATAQGT